MTSADYRAAFRDALVALEAAHARLSAAPNDDAAFAAWCGAVEVVKVLHQPLADAATERARKAGR